MRVLKLFLFLFLSELCTNAQDSIQAGPQQLAPNIVEGLKLSQYTATTLDVLKHSGIIEILEVGGPFTFFSPDRLAFERLGDFYNKFRNDTKAMENWVKFHTVRHVYSYEDLKVNELTLWTLLPKRIRVNYYQHSDTLLIEGSRIMAKNLRTKNGIIHVVHDAFFPPKGTIMDTLYNDPDFTTFAHAVEISGMQQILQNDGPFTLFAPENSAFLRFGVQEWQDLQRNVSLLRDVVKYHLIRGTIYSVGILKQSYPSMYNRTGLNLFATIMGDTIYANGAVVSEKDIHATNGVVHKLSKFLVPPDLHDVIHSNEPFTPNNVTTAFG